MFGAVSDDARELQPIISLLRATLESTADGILVVDRDGRIVTSNRQFAVMWRIPPEVLTSRDDERAIAFVLDQLRDPEQFLSKVRELYSTPEAESFDLLDFKDGRLFERYSRPQWVEGRAVGRVWSFRDVTLRKRLEEELRQAQKLEAVGRLAGGIAHDFNNLLTTILGYSDLLLRGRPDDPELQEDVGEIRKASERAAALTRQLLAFSRKQVIEPRVLDLNALVVESSRMLRRLIGEDIELSTSLDPDLPSVRADPIQIEQVIVNLAVNARDAMPGGGRLSIQTTVRRVEEGRARPGDPAAGDCVALVVSDTGSGMDAATQERIFEPFFTTKEKGKGTGLGLSTAYGIVKQSGGDIRVTSMPSSGSTFEILLPAVEDKPDDHAAKAPVGRVAAPRHATVLLAEDEDGLRALNGRVLEARGYRVLAASNAAEALLLAERQPEPPDLLVTDVVMPGASGRELARRLRDRHPGLKVLYVSGYAEDARIEDDASFLQKPFTPEGLSERVAELLTTEVRQLLTSMAGESGRGRASVKVGAAQVVAAGAVRAEQLALLLEERGPAVRADPRGLGRSRRARLGRGVSNGLGGSRKLHEPMMLSPARSAKRYFGEGDGDGDGLGVVGGAGVVPESILRTRPAGVRSTSMGVVSGVGGAGAGASAPP